MTYLPRIQNCEKMKTERKTDKGRGILGCS
jgi:hypothetical protein